MCTELPFGWTEDSFQDIVLVRGSKAPQTLRYFPKGMLTKQLRIYPYLLVVHVPFITRNFSFLATRGGIRVMWF